jgi:hypothetical protein
MEINITCPLGSQCEEIKNNQVHRCAWYTKIIGKNPNGEDVNDWGCAIAFMPMLQIEMSQTNRGQTAALESFRNETAEGQKQFNNIMSKRVLTN